MEKYRHEPIPLAGDVPDKQPACRDEDPELFFPHGKSGPALIQIEEAKEVCRRCPITQVCLEWALNTDSHGIWGGTTEDERKAIRARQIRAQRRRAS